MRSSLPLVFKREQSHYLTYLPILSNVTSDSPNFCHDELWMKSLVRSCPEIYCSLFEFPVVNTSHGKRLEIQAAVICLELRASWE